MQTKEDKYAYNCAWLQANINDMQILCANCNWIKRVENNEHLPGFKREARALKGEPDEKRKV